MIVLFVSTLIAWLIISNLARVSVSARTAGRRSLMFAQESIGAAGGAEQVLRSCRSMLDEYPPKKNDWCHSVVMNEVTNLAAQLTLRKMKIREVLISSNQVSFVMRAPDRGCRSFQILAFKEKTPEYGSIMLTNGLWYFDGCPSKESRKLYYDEVNRRMGRRKK
jgi:hypothetical protein